MVTAVNGLPWWYFYGLDGPYRDHRLKSVDADDQQWNGIGPERVIGCVVYPAAEVVEPGVVRHVEGNRFTLGEPTGERTERAQRLGKAMIAAGFKAPVRPRIRDEIWVKLWGNLCFNPISALTGETLDVIATVPGTREVARRMMLEAHAIAETLGVRFPVDVDARIAGAAEVDKHKTSMLQDLEHRPGHGDRRPRHRGPRGRAPGRDRDAHHRHRARPGHPAGLPGRLLPRLSETPAGGRRSERTTSHATLDAIRARRDGRLRNRRGDTITVFEGDMFAGSAATSRTLKRDEVRVLTPCEPSKMIALWNNFHALAAKLNQPEPEEPLYFLKAANSFLADGEAIRKPGSYDGSVAYEGELGVVIGKRCKEVDEANADACSFGYTCVNDVTALELLNRDPTFAQWTRAKSFDTFGVFGPVVATGLDPDSLVVRTLLNGRERQNYPAGDMIFPPRRLVSLISQDMTLNPGDVICCGTSLGVLPMRPGTTVEVAIDGIGVLSNVFEE